MLRSVCCFPKNIHVFYKKQMCDSVITGNENTSKDWNCVMLMFRGLISYFVFGYECFMCICLKTTLWLFSFVWEEVWLLTLA